MNLNYRLGLVTAAFLLLGFASSAQNSSVSIGTANTNSSAVLWLNSPGQNQGLIIPVGSRTNVATPVKGMLIFDTNEVYAYDGTNWNTVGGSSGSGSTYSLSYNASTKVISLNPNASGTATIDISTTALSGGDLGGTLGTPSVTGILSKSITLPSSGVQYLSYDVTQAKWVFQTPSGSGDMLKATYDPTNKNADAFDLTKHAGVLPIANGGTGLSTTPINGQLLIGNGTGYTGSTLTAGTNVSITNGAGSITINSAGLSNPMNAANQMIIGGIGGTPQSLTSPSANQVLTSDNTSAVKWASVLPIASGGTGASTAVTALANLGALGNPMNAAGDIIYGGAAGVPTKLATGTGFLKGGAIPSYTAVNLASTDVSGTLPFAKGGTGLALGVAPANGQLFMGNGAGFTVGTLTAGTNISVVNGAGSITINSTALANPMTSAGDIIYGGVAGVATRLAGGATGVLKSNGTTPSWGTIVDADINSSGITTAGKVSGSAITSGTIGGSTVINTSGDIISTGGSLAISGTTTFGGIKYTWPTTPLAAPTKYLSSDAAGNLNWATVPSPFTTLNTIPKGDGTTMIASQIFDDGTNVGIGTTAPLQRLHLKIPAAGAGVAQLRLQDNISFWDIAAGNDLQIRNGAGTGQLTLWSTGVSSFIGNVGIDASPVSKLDVNGDVHLAQLAAPPGPFTDKLYNVGGSLFWNGNNISSGSTGWGLSGNSLGGTDFIGSTNSQDLIFKTNSIERARINTSGYLGIGTNIPGTVLHAVWNLGGNINPIATIETLGAGSAAALRFRNSSGQSYNMGILSTGDFSISSLNNNVSTSDAIRLSSAGNVGINLSNPSTKLHVLGTNTFVTVEESGTSNHGVKFVRGGVDKWLFHSNYSTPADNIGFYDYSVGKNVFQINQGGNVGIGTTSPVNKLDVEGGMVIGATYAGTNTAPTNGLLVQGNLGVGVTSFSSGAKLEVTGGDLYITDSFPFITLNTSSNGNAGVVMKNSGTSRGWMYYAASSTEIVLSNTVGGGTKHLAIGTGGLVGIGMTATANDLEVNGTASKTVAGSWIANSDRRIKTDIRDIDHGLDLIKKLRPVKFKYTDEWMKKHPSIKNQYYYNFIAQEFQEVFPEAVKGSGEYVDGDKKEILQIDTYNAQIVSIKAIQELQKIIEEQRKQIEELKGQQNQKETTAQSELNQLKVEIANIKKALGMEVSTKKK